LIAPTLNSESLTNVSCASNQIVKDLCRSQTHPYGNARYGRPRNLPATLAKNAHGQP
jgi:hypothetical protein